MKIYTLFGSGFGYSSGFGSSSGFSLPQFWVPVSVKKFKPIFGTVPVDRSLCFVSCSFCT